MLYSWLVIDDDAKKTGTVVDNYDDDDDDDNDGNDADDDDDEEDEEKAGNVEVSIPMGHQASSN